MTNFLFLWVALVIVLLAFAIGRPREGGALTLAYFLGLSLIHVPGVLAFLSDGRHLGGDEETGIGFELTLLGMAAFVAGAIVARQIGRHARPAAILSWHQRVAGFQRLSWRMLVIGFVTYFVLLPVSTLVPSLTVVIATLGTLLVVGLWLRLYGTVLAENWKRMLATLALLPLLPLATLATGGFLGYGINWVLSAIAFLFMISRKRIWFYAASPFVLFLGLSLFVTYMGQRIGIRDIVWHEKATLSDRLDRISTIVTEFQLLDLESWEHREALNDRLNQNFLVGTGMRQHQDGLVELEYGDTVPWWALIPRAIWSDKPAIGGSGSTVSDFTGIEFTEGTSVGVGQVLEFYMNFGVPGEVIGFALFGFLLMWLDRGIVRSLAVGDVRGYMLWAMPGLTLLQPGGSLLEMLVACVAAIIVSRILVSFKFFTDMSAVEHTAAGNEVRLPRGARVTVHR